MAETSYYWGGTTTGDAGTYSDDNFSDVFRYLFQKDRTIEGVIYGPLSDLLPSVLGTTLSIASGIAMVDGKVYYNSASVNHSLSVPATGTNYYRLVLRKDFNLQTVRQVLLGPSLVSYPSVTQNDGTTWEISLAKVTVTSTSVVTLTDDREFCHYNTILTVANIEDFDYASAAEILTGTEDSKAVTPDALHDAGFIGIDLISGVPHKQLWIGGLKPELTSGSEYPDQIEMASGNIAFDFLAFDKDSVERSYANFPMPQDYTGGVLYAKFYWFHPATTVNFKVYWGINASSMDNGESMDVSQGTSKYIMDTGGVTSKLYISDLTDAITPSGSPGAGHLIHLRAFRSASDVSNDTLAVDAYLIGVMIWYPVE